VVSLSESRETRNDRPILLGFSLYPRIIDKWFTIASIDDHNLAQNDRVFKNRAVRQICYRILSLTVVSGGPDALILYCVNRFFISVSKNSSMVPNLAPRATRSGFGTGVAV
jgi:hypothetical protein